MYLSDAVQEVIKDKDMKTHIYRKGWKSLGRSIGAVYFDYGGVMRSKRVLSEYVYERCMFAEPNLTDKDIMAEDWEIMTNPRELLTIDTFLEMPMAKETFIEIAEITEGKRTEFTRTDDTVARFTELTLLGMIRQSDGHIVITDKGKKFLDRIRR